MPNDNKIEPGVEFQSLPLEMLILTPLTAVVKAQKASADATLAFIRAFLDAPDPSGAQKATTLKLATTQTVQAALPAGGVAPPAPIVAALTIEAPLLAMVPVPHLRIDAVTINFKFEVGQTYQDKSQTSGSLDLTAKTGAVLSPWAEASLKGSVSSSSQQDNTVHRGGVLDITVRASEAPMPAGLDRLLTLLSRGVP